MKNQTRESQNKLVKSHLEQGKAISTFTAIRRWHITRLSARIWELKNSGMEIYGKMVNHHDKRYKVYYMSNSRHFKVYGKSY